MAENKKYRLTDETIEVDGVTLYRIEALKTFGDVKSGDKGGYIQQEKNLSQERYCWVFGDAMVFGDAKVYGNAEVYDNAKVFGDAKVSKLEDYIVFKNWWSSGRYFTWTRSNDKWKVGCFYGTGEELIAKAYKDSEKSGREYERVVRFVELILKDNR